ncbi:MAG: hypothetical protein Fur0018_10420 [Anaerolineales bacterium]
MLAVHLQQQAVSLGVWETSRRWQAVVVLSALTACGALVFWGWLWRATPAWLPVLERLAVRLRRVGVGVTLLYPAGVFLLVWHPVYGGYFTGSGVHLALLWLGASFCAFWLGAGRGAERSPAVWLGGVLSYQAAIYTLLWFLAPVSHYPLSGSWSETSRYYYASLFLSPRLYGFRAAWPALHPSRYLLQSVPFWFGSLPLWAHRAWQGSLWIGLTLAAAGGVTRRLRLPDRWYRWGFLWGAVLFLLQGPVYYHLLVMVVMVACGVDFAHPRRTWGVLLAASLWAGISRVNWFPVPAVLVAVLYFLERPQGERAWWRYWLPPLGWGVAGTAAALLSQAVYAAVSGNPPQDFGTSFTSDLLWYRLLPNPTFPQGLLPMALAVALPVVVLIAWRTRLPFSRWFPLAGLSAGLFLGGLVVSVKIGGGNNLHNLDGCFVLLLLWGGYAFWERITPERRPVSESLTGGAPPWGLVALLMVMPLYWALSSGGARVSKDVSPAREAINAIRQKTEAAAERGEAVLFISERHLLTFGEIDVPLIPEYERTFLMEMAMAHNEPYLRRFREDLASHRFALIVVQPLNLNLQGREAMFGEENDAWVQGVAAPLLCYYEPVKVWRKVSVQIMAPRDAVNMLACEMMEK